MVEMAHYLEHSRFSNKTAWADSLTKSNDIGNLSRKHWKNTHKLKTKKQVMEKLIYS